jgi:hypothetical protein
VRDRSRPGQEDADAVRNTKSPKSGAGHEDVDGCPIKSWAVSGEALRSIETRGRDDVDPLVRVTLTVSIKTPRRMAERAGSKRLAKFTRRGMIEGYNAGDETAARTGKVFDASLLAARGR